MAECPAVISPAGCVASAAVTRGVDISLDIESLRAVTQWRFTPTLLDGQPVPVIIDRHRELHAAVKPGHCRVLRID